MFDADQLENVVGSFVAGHMFLDKFHRLLPICSKNDMTMTLGVQAPPSTFCRWRYRNFVD